MTSDALRKNFTFQNIKLIKRHFYHYLNYIFNRVDESRVKEVGIDRACAEWLMRNGAYVRWVGEDNFVEHYNSLPLDKPVEIKYYIEEVKAVGASIDHHGFPHFRGCEHIRIMKMLECWYINDKCMEYMNYLEGSLTSLEVSNCAEISDKGLEALSSLKKLETLYIGQLQGVKDLKSCLSFIQMELPDCKIINLPKM